MSLFHKFHRNVSKFGTTRLMIIISLYLLNKFGKFRKHRFYLMRVFFHLLFWHLLKKSECIQTEYKLDGWQKDLKLIRI